MLVAKNMLPPYRMPFLNELGAKVELTLVLDNLSEPGRSWVVDPEEMSEVTTHVLGSKVVGFEHGQDGFRESRVRQMSWGVLKYLNRVKPDCVVSTEFGLRSLLASLWCRLHGKPLIIWWEGTLHTERGQSRKRSQMRKVLTRLCTRFWSNGKASEDYLVSLGVDRDVVDNGMTGIDTQFFFEQGQKAAAERDGLRKRFGFEGKTIVFSGALSPRKGIRELMSAIEALYAEGYSERVTIALAGKGEEKGFLENWKAPSEKVQIVLLGFLQLEDLPKLYAAGDLFVLPSLEDNWALATLEPLICGLPSLVSIRNGAHADLAGEGVISFDPCHEDEFLQALRTGLEMESRLSEERVRVLTEYYRSRHHAERAYLSIQGALSC